MLEKSPKIEIKVKRKKAPKDVELTVLSNCYLGFPKTFFNPPQKQKTDFYMGNFSKIQNFQKTAQHVVELYLDIKHVKFQVDISIFDKHIA